MPIFTASKLALGTAALGGAVAVAMVLNLPTAPLPQSATRPGVTPAEPPSHAVPQPGIGPSESLEDLRREVAQLRADLRRVQQDLEARGHAPASAAPAPEEDEELADPEPHSADEIALLEQQQIETHALAIEARLEAETADSAWSGRTAGRILEIFTGEKLGGAALQDIDCRATLCRVEVQHRDEAKLREFQHLFPFKVAQVLPRLMMHRMDNADGSITTYLYLAREGHRLPTAESGS